MWKEGPLEKISQKVTNKISNVNPKIFNPYAMQGKHFILARI